MSERYARHEQILEWNQAKLGDSQVIIVGMGALGNEVARILTMAGVGKFILYDHDVVEESNLSRTFLFRERHIGKLKVEAAEEILYDINPEINIQTCPYKFSQGLGLATIRDSSLVISCLDSKSSRMWLSARCNMVKAPMVDGGTHPWGGEVRPYLNQNGACYGCGMSLKERSVMDMSQSCLNNMEDETVGSAIPSTALVGSWMGNIAVRFLMNLPVTQNIISIDGIKGTTSMIEMKKTDECPFHTYIENVVKVNVGSKNTLGELRKVIPNGSIPIATEAFQKRFECSKCGFSEEKWQVKQNLCPICKFPVKSSTKFDMDSVPDDVILGSIGIPSMEIIAVRTKDGYIWVELNN